MGVSLSVVHTSVIGGVLSKGMNESTNLSLQLATGDKLQHAYQDPTGLVISARLEATKLIKETVLTGLKQSQAMIYNAEEGVKSIHETLRKMQVVATRAQLGYMTDDLVEMTLGPVWMQYKAEIDRVAETTEFNGQKLLDATGGVTSAGTATASGTSGVSANSTFTFVCGQNLQNDLIKAVLPNMRLENKTVGSNTILGAVSTLNITGYSRTALELSEMKTVADAKDDSILLQGLCNLVLDALSDIGALQARFNSVEDELTGSIQQIALAIEPIIKTDLAEASSKLAKINAQITFAITRIAAENKLLERLERLAQ